MNNIKITLFLIFAVYFLISQNGAPPVEAAGEEQADADTIMTEREYYSKLQAAGEETFEQDFETYFLFLLESEQKKDYEDLQSLEEKKAYIYYYWKASNPNPLFPENDWLLEFNRRVRYAKKHFRRTVPPFVDDRGEYYIKYGEPRRFVDSGGLVSTDERFKRRSAPVVEKPKGKDERSSGRSAAIVLDTDDTFRIRYWTLPNETWSYENIQPNFVVYFVRDGASYRQAQSIYDAVLDRHAMRNAVRATAGAPDPNLEYYIWRDMIEKRDHISPALARAALPIRVLEGTGPPHIVLRDRANELTSHIEMARYKAPSAARDPIHVENNLEFFDRVTQFRGPPGKTRIDVALLVPLKKNLIEKVRESSEDTVSMEFSGMLRDENFEPVTKNQSSLSLAVELAAREKLPNAIGNFSLLVKPQDAELTLQVQEKQREKTGYDRRSFQIRDFSSKTELMLSDIQLNYRVKNDVQKKILPISRQGDFLVSPYPFHEVRKKKPPLVYFEIYNIQSAGMGEIMQISYTITPIKGDEASVNVSFTRPALSEKMHELVEIDLKNVKKGWNHLKVVVSSLQDSTIQAVSQKKISVKE